MKNKNNLKKSKGFSIFLVIGLVSSMLFNYDSTKTSITENSNQLSTILTSQEVQQDGCQQGYQDIKLLATNKKSITVYITRTGTKYHRSGCRYLSKSKIAISLKNAEASGYDACKICNPPR